MIINIGDVISWFSDYCGVECFAKVCSVDDDKNYGVYVNYAGGQDRIPHSEVLSVYIEKSK